MGWKENFAELMNEENHRVEEKAVVEQEIATIGKDEVRKTLKG